MLLLCSETTMAVCQTTTRNRWGRAWHNSHFLAFCVCRKTCADIVTLFWNYYGDLCQYVRWQPSERMPQQSLPSLLRLQKNLCRCWHFVQNNKKCNKIRRTLVRQRLTAVFLIRAIGAVSLVVAHVVPLDAVSVIAGELVTPAGVRWGHCHAKVTPQHGHFILQHIHTGTTRSIRYMAMIWL